MLTLSEEAMLLLYSRVRPAGSRDKYDTLAHYGSDIRLLAGAALMDLVLLGKVQVRPVSPTTRRLLAAIRVLLFLLLAALLFVPPRFATLNGMPLPVWLTPGTVFTLGFIIVFLLVAVVTWGLGRVFGDQLTILDGGSTGDVVLDEALGRLTQVGPHASLRAYLRALRYSTLAKLMRALIAQLEQKGLLSRPIAGPTFFGLLDRRLVQRERTEFAAIGEHLRRVVLDHTEVETHAVALLLLFAWSFRRLGTPVAGGVYQFFTPTEYPQLQALLRAMRRGDATLGTQMNPGLYEALRAIAVTVHQLRGEDSSGS
jgi:hypothetical protein